MLLMPFSQCIMGVGCSTKAIGTALDDAGRPCHAHAMDIAMAWPWNTAVYFTNKTIACVFCSGCHCPLPDYPLPPLPGTGATAWHWRHCLALAPLPGTGATAWHWRHCLALAPLPGTSTGATAWHWHCTGTGATA